MEKLNLNSLTKEQIALASKCQTPEELIELAKEAGIELTKEEAQAYLDELENMELDKETLDKVAGGDGTTRTINAKLYG
jgi:type III secretion system FlhB-like substrate exporter